jgi:hypothetical protein
VVSPAIRGRHPKPLALSKLSYRPIELPEDESAY